ncbi:ComEC/Rec2 family competence protein [Microbacterium sp. Root53]|uniref:ComEC/Rec2 family competence protein n=1 Tax=Microbacterium sp. Root53 TaxID=1736553 RepID=UPI000A8472E6|nr:ComEC/Rec2 family competence protein [Microbacterium sp. Root53]
MSVIEGHPVERIEPRSRRVVHAVDRVGARDMRLVPVAIAAWAVALWAVAVPASAGAVSIAAWLLALGGVLAWRWVGARTACAVAVLACAAAGAVSGHVALAHPAREAAVAFATGGGRAIEVEVVVASKVERHGDALWFDAEAAAVRRDADSLLGAVPVTVSVPQDAVSGAGLDLGSTAVARGSAQPGDAGERAALVVFAREVQVTSTPPAGLDLAAELRDGLVERASALPAPGAMLLPGLAVGDTRAVSEDLDAAMKAASLSHLTAVSGANCALVVGIAFGAAALLGAARGVRVAVAPAALAGFVVLVTPEPSVVRAATMASIALLALVLGRVGAGVSVLALATTVLVIADPWLSASYGFVLSVVATGSLLLLARPLAAGLSRWMPSPLALALSVPLAAQLACGPVLVLLAPEVPAYGVVANLLAAPAAPLVTIVGLAACLAAPLPVLADGLAAVAWVPSAWIAATAQTVSALPGARVLWPPGLGGAVLLALAGAAAGVLIARAGRIGAWDVWARRVGAAGLALGTGAAVGATALTGVAGPLAAPRDWAIAACDVGQGDALVVRSAGSVAVIDTGPEPEPLSSCLARLGVARVDLLVLTHFDVDHAGGAAALRDRVGTVLHGPLGEAADARALDELGAAQRIQVAAGATGMLGSARWRVLWPRAASAAFPAGNDASVVIEIAGPDVPRSILLGDLSASAQAALLGTGLLAGPYPVVKVAHHGSADQLPELYGEIGPSVALVTVGADNDYGHPREEILTTLAALGASVARTDRSGLVLVSPSPDGVTVWRERPP